MAPASPSLAPPRYKTPMIARTACAAILAAASLTPAAQANRGDFALAAPASAPAVLAYVRVDAWPAAEEAASRWLDPVARKYVQYDRLTAPGAASVAEIDSFLHANLDWPGNAALTLRREQALAAEPDDATALPFCARLKLTLPTALLRCAGAFAHAGQGEAADAAARQAWLRGLAGADAERRFMQHWGHAVTPADQWRRFDRVASDPPAAQRQLARLDAAHRQAAQVLLALRHDDPRAPAMLAALPAAMRADPALMLAEAARLERAGRFGDATQLWTSAGADAERAADPARLPGFWDERDRLARDLLATGDAATAYTLAATPGRIAPRQALDADFLAGWIALRWLHDPARAAPHFTALAAASKAAITEARAHYWLARCAAARGDAAAARSEFTVAARWPTTYYGQLAALALDNDPAALNARITALSDPPWTTAQALAFLGQEDARAAALLVAWGEKWRARPFLQQLAANAAGPAGQAMAARLALGFGLPDQAVAIARRAGVGGLVLADAGWPTSVVPPPGPVEPAVILGLIRQESSFDTAAASPVGARGLMQLMPDTAREVALQLGDDLQLVSLTGDPRENVRLGDSYLQNLLDRFSGFLPLALSAYNAGAARVEQWLTANGDPRGGGAIGMIDWIELIPFVETRNYVQRVVENVAVYRAREGVVRPYPVEPWHD